MKVCASGRQGRCGHFLALASALIAGLALAGLNANVGANSRKAREIAELAYRYADEMERERK